MIKPLHPTLKACSCGFIGTRRELYKHFSVAKQRDKDFFAKHGESVLNIDDPRVALTQRESDIAANI